MVVGYIDATDGCTNGSADRITYKQDNDIDLKDSEISIADSKNVQNAVPEKIQEICCRTTTDKDQIAETVVDVVSSSDESTAECYSSDDESNAVDTVKNNNNIVPGPMKNELSDCKDFWLANTVNITNNYQKQTLDVEQLKYLADNVSPKLLWSDGLHSHESMERAHHKVSRRLITFVAIGVSVLILIIIAVGITIWQLNKPVAVANIDNGCGKTGGLVTRDAWGALEPKSASPDLNVIPPQIVIVASTEGPTCSTESECRKIVQNIQISVMSRGGNDIPFNFLVGGDCNIYEGVGWNKTGNHTITFNDKSIGLAFIGSFMTSPPSQAQVDSGLAWLDFGAQSNNLAPDYVVFVQKQVTPFQSPGVQMIPCIKRWKHWSANVTVTPTLFNFTNPTSQRG